jgi:DNA primase
MYISRSFINELMARVDIVDLIESYLSLRKAGRNYTACCPFHHEKTPSFNVSPEKQFYYCFGCGAHGSVIGFLMEYAHLNFVEAVHELASRVGLEVVYEQGDGEIAAKMAGLEELYQVMEQAAQYYRQQLRQSKSAIDYLKKRGLTGEMARDFGLGYAPPGWNNLLKTLGTDSDMRTRLLKTGLIKQSESGHRYDHFRDRVMFPILDMRGRVIAFGGRSHHDKENEPKYLNSPETPLFKKSSELYGWYHARKVRDLSKIIIVEGYMDVLALAQFGFQNVVATLGTATSRQHLTRLFHNVPEIIFCFDGDQAGRKAAWRALEIALPLLQDGRSVNYVFLPQGEDPDSLVRQSSTEGFESYLNQAQPLSDFLFDTLTQPVNLNTSEGKARLVQLAKPLLMQLPVGAYRDLMLQRLSQLTAINPNHLNRLTPRAERTNQPPTNKKLQPLDSMRDIPLVHQAIIYLLHKPALSIEITSDYEKLSQLKQTDIKLLLNMIELTRNNPQLKLGTICEHWRGTEYEPTINQLARQKTLFTTTDIDIDKEFFDTLNRLNEQYAKQRTQELYPRITELTDEEKQELISLSQA